MKTLFNCNAAGSHPAKYLLLICALGLFSCNAQETPQKDRSIALNWNPVADSLSKPDVRVNVKKEYDKDGNIVRLDSTYTYSFGRQWSGSIQPGNNGWFPAGPAFDRFPPFAAHSAFSDSLFTSDWFGNGFSGEPSFEKRFQAAQQLMEELSRQMGVLPQNQFRTLEEEKSGTRKRNL